MASSQPNVRDGEALLRGVIGARLTSVPFVGALTTLVWPEICDGESTFRLACGLARS